MAFYSSLRQLYLRFGPATLVGCQFCHPDDPLSYILYHLPTNTLLPHLFHILVLGLATSETVSGADASAWRHSVLVSALVLAALDVFLTSTYPSTPVATSTLAPAGPFWMGSTLRYLSLVLFDAAVSFLIYASTTGRFYIFPSSVANAPADAETLHRRAQESLTQASLALQMTATNLRAYSIARNAVVRNDTLKSADDEYWRTVVAVEGEGGGDESLFEDEEVQAAVARVYGSGGFDVATVRREAEGFVKHATRALG